MSNAKPPAKDDGKGIIKILLVDDMPEAREGIKKLLQFEQKFKVIGSASNGREGVQQARELRPDIVIMDINMPDMDGLEAAALITKSLPTTGVIMMSVQDDTDYMQRAMLAGARFFLPKPPDMDKLFNTIQSVYEQYDPIRRQFEAIQKGALEAAIKIAEGDEGDGEGGDRAGHVIVVYSPTGGAGCTTLATSLVSGLTKEGIRTLLIDADLQFGDVATFLNLKPQQTLVDVIETANDLDIDYFENILTNHDSGIKVLLGPARPAMGVEIRDQHAETLGTLIDSIRGYYDFIVIDTSKSIDNVTAMLLEKASKVVVVINPSLPSIKNTRLILDWFDATGFPPEKTCLVVNKAITDPAVAKAKSVPTPDKIQAYLKRPVEGIIPAVDDKIILGAINKGIPVIAADRDTSKAPIKQLLQLSDVLYNGLMGIEMAEVAADTKQGNTSSIIKNLFGRK
jgi:pilus assembly protein CpaE